jgi:hypothetical protein
MPTSKLKRLFFVLGALALISAAPAQSAPAFPAHPGFPRTDPAGRIDFSSPLVIDVNNDGQLDVLVGDSAGCIWAFNRNGNVVSGFPWKTSGRSTCEGDTRIDGPLAAGDVDGNDNGRPEIVAGTLGVSNNAGQRGKVFVFNADGSLLSGWPEEMAWDATNAVGRPEVQVVALGDMAGDSKLEVFAGTTNNANRGSTELAPPNVYAWYASSALVGSGYPTGYRQAGVYSGLGVADLTQDGKAELVVGRDHKSLHAYNASGNWLSGWPISTYVDVNKQKWGQDKYIEFTNNAPVIGDLNGDGVMEIVIAGKVRDPLAGNKVTHNALVVFKPDGTRFPGWNPAKLQEGPLTEDFPPSMAPALADINGDGKLEIIVATFDGKIRAYKHDGVKLWSYNYANGKKLFASEPVIGDVTGDGKLDIIFGTYSPKRDANGSVGIIGLDRNGVLLPGFPLALNKEKGDYAGVRAAPTLIDFDGDCKVEILAASWGSALYVWDLTAAYNRNNMPWPTARHDNWRGGSYTGPNIGPTCP